MKEKIHKISSSINRLLSNDFLALRFYQYWALGTFVLFGVLGIYPVSKVIFQKVPIVSQMRSLNKDLTEKADRLAELEEIIADVKTDAVYLQNYLPDTFDLQNYMVDFVITTAQAGFLIDRFTPETEKDNTTDIAVYLSGEGDLVELVSQLESLDRITEIIDMNYTQDSSGNRLRLLVKVYSMQK